MKIVIVGGGAGGLELAASLGESLGKKGKAEVVLVDCCASHVWKPLLHEIASGSMDAGVDAVSYRAHAHLKHYTFRLGRVTGIDRKRRKIILETLRDEDGAEVLPRREIGYDYLVLAIGSQVNDFGIEGVGEYCVTLDNQTQAQRFHQRLVNHLVRLDYELQRDRTVMPLELVIIGGGATGVELAAELVKAWHWFKAYGLDHIGPGYIRISLVEAGDRLVPALTEQISGDVMNELENLGVRVRLSTPVKKIDENGVWTGSGELIRADSMVWAAGIRAPEWLTDIEGLVTNKLNQVLVRPDLRVSGDDRIFAIGDCAGCKMTDSRRREKWIPPRAQSAHQMARTVSANLKRCVDGKEPFAFKYRDFGSLVSLSQYNAFGRLMGGLMGGRLNVKGRFARLSYLSLYRMHQLAIFGGYRAVLVAISDQFNHIIRPRMKLH